MKNFRIFEHAAMGVLFTILIVLLWWLLLEANDLQGTARVVNYSGIVRGGSQRIIKLEIAGTPDDELIDQVEEILSELKNGGTDYQLEALPDNTFQNALSVQTQYWQEVREAIRKARTEGWENTGLLDMSELYFNMCDKTTSLAESYSEKLAADLRKGEIAIFVTMFLLSILIIRRFLEAAREIQKNRILNQKAYFDRATNVRNRQFFEEYFPEILREASEYVFCFMDIDGLKYVNDTFGHAEGDHYINSFVDKLKKEFRVTDIIFRLGGDEFALFLNGCSEKVAIRQLEAARSILMSDSSRGYMPSFSYGTVYVGTDEKRTVEELLQDSDARMYAYKMSHKRGPQLKQEENNEIHAD